ncbi:class I SAM-dependent DNA methyltransferase [Streptomyces hainanensis]|uniref:Class I SAM-dependent methyltransferase n=1 Tax=Streptomyces hainanensis TaxID=402648 RepID=A0A4R4TES3_9ACTN|nr:class I SAM-dependent methyltransferase [Streptomyces hainanensis]TDC73662.1 class I SAM-dependent methyltransferase [Streptomyces hainanensis]
MTDAAGFLAETRSTYDTVALDYDEVIPPVTDDPLDVALLGDFAARVTAAGGGPVVEAGCGTGRITGHLAAAGLDASGVDLSPAMLAVARRAHPEIRFAEGSLLALDLPDAGLAGLVAWYSVIHLPPDRLPSAFVEFHRVLRPGGWLQLAFHVGDRRHHRTEGYGHRGISLDIYWLPVERVAALLAAAGFVLETEVVRDVSARVPQARLLAAKPLEDTP